MPDHNPNEGTDLHFAAPSAARQRVRQPPSFDAYRSAGRTGADRTGADRTGADRTGAGRAGMDDAEAMGGPAGFRMPQIDLRREDLRTQPTDELLPGAEQESGYRRSHAGGGASRGGAGLDQATRKLAMVAGGIGVALVGFVGLWSVMHGSGGPVPVIEADSRPLRVKPSNPGGMQISGADDAILSGASEDAPESVAPAPEAPMPGRLSPPAEMAANTPALNAPPALQEEKEALPVPKAPDIKAPGIKTPEAKAPDSSAARVKPAPAKAAEDDEEEDTPSTPVQATPVQAAPLQAVPAQPRPAVPQRPAQAPANTATPYATTGHVTVQLAALGSEEAARAEWSRLSHRLPALLGNRQPSYSQTQHDGKTYWRLRTGGFVDAAAAKSFCTEIRAKGGGCSVATF